MRVRTGARWVELTDGSGAGVRVAASGAPFGFSALRHDAAALDAAAHPHELPQGDGPVHLCVDAAMMGVGGDTGWSRSVLPAYTVPAGTYRHALSLRAVVSDEERRAAERGSPPT